MRYSHVTPDSRKRAMQIIERQIGGGENENGDLRKIFDAVAAGKMTFEEFRKTLQDSFAVF